jgi:DNA polymerase III subunit beta
MKIKINQKKLKEGINLTEKISIKSSSLPILKNILIKAQKNYINLIATDLEIGIKWWALAEVEKEGETVIPSGVLSSFIGFLPEKQVEISSSKNDLLVNCDTFKTQIKGLGSDEFPIVPEVAEKTTAFINSESLCKGLSQINDIPSFSTNRPEISGVLFSFKKDKMKMVATDSYRLGEKTVNLEKNIKEDFSFILPQKAAKEVVNVFSEKEGEIKIVSGANQVLFEILMSGKNPHPEIQLISRLIDGEYPNYEEIIPSKSETKIIVDRAELINQIKASSVFGGKINEVKLKINPEKKGIGVFSESVETGEFNSFVSAQIKGKKEEISFNHRFLLDGLSNIKTAEVSFEVSSSSSPGVIRPVGGSDFFYIVMPVKAD